MKKRMVLAKGVLICSYIFLFSANALADPFKQMFFNSRRMQEQKRFQQFNVANQGKSLLQKQLVFSGASIAGTVYRADLTKHSMAYISVIDTFGFEVANVQSTTSGSYMVQGLYAGIYCLWSATSYPDRTYFGNTSDINKAQWVHVSADEQVVGKDIVEVPSTKKGVVLAGKCYLGDANDSPFGCNFTLRVIPSDQARRAVFSSINGYYSLYSSSFSGSYACSTSLEQGSYYIMIQRGSIYGSSIDTNFIAQWWDGSSITAEPTALLLSSEIVNKDIHFRTGSIISGAIRDEISDSLIESVTIDLIDKGGYTLSSAYCGNNSRKFAFSGLPGGAYYLYVAYSRDDFYKATYYPQARVRDSATAISVGASDKKEGISFVLKRTAGAATQVQGTIKGTITREDNGAALPFASITFGGSPGWTSTSISADKSGIFQKNVPADSAVYVSAKQSSSASNGTIDYYLAETWYPGVTSPTTASPVKVLAGGTKEISIAVKKGGSIAGWVRDQNNGKIARLFSVLSGGTYLLGYAWTTDFSQFTATFVSDLSGFRVAGLRAGTYQMRFFGINGLFSENAFSDYGYATIPSISVTNENTAFSRVVTLPLPSSTISGAVAASPVLLGGNQPTDFIYCYSSDSIIAGGSMPRPSAMQSPRTLFLSSDQMVYSSGKTLHFGFGKFPSGKYAVAHYRINGQNNSFEREWYPGGGFENLETSNYPTYMKTIFKPDIPSSAWITLGDNEAKANVNFGNAGILHPASNGPGAAPWFRLTQGLSGQNIIIHYSIPPSDVRKTGTLTIVRVDGVMVRSIGLFKNEGDVIWNGCSDNGAPVCTGVYVFRLISGSAALTLKGTLVK